MVLAESSNIDEDVELPKAGCEKPYVVDVVAEASEVLVELPSRYERLLVVVMAVADSPGLVRESSGTM